MSKKIVTRFLILGSLFVLLPILFFILNFRGQLISGKIEHWAQFGDYVGGLINTVISLLNLAVLIYITKWLKTVEDDRNKQNLQDLAIPFPDFLYSKIENVIEIKIMNGGLGPLIINDLFFTEPSGGKIRAVNDLVLNKAIIKKYYYSGLLDDRWAIAKETEVIIFRIEFANVRNLQLSSHFQTQLKYLNSLSISIRYSDVYGRDMGYLNGKVKFLLNQFTEEHNV